ncbi:MAG: hypothetical protein IJ011_05470 [Clostridia bacterium]|nr:hypothetical protein [Clostridia bacterium]
MKQNLKRLLSILLCLCMCAGALISLASCKDNGDVEESGSVSETDSETETEASEPDYTLTLASGGKTDYVIIVPMDSELFTEEMLAAVNSLIDAFKNYTGVEIEYTEDFMGWDVEPDDAAYEILIGETNRPQSAAAIEGMGFSEYVIKADGNKLVINGVGTKAIVSAINYFITNMIKDNSALSYGTTGELVFKTENDYHKQSQYFIKSIKLLGEDISNCQIVYPEGGYAEEYFATLLKKHITTYSGISLDVVSDKNATAGKAILIGNTSRTTITPEDGKYNIEVTDKGLEVVSNDIFSYISVNVKFQAEVFKYSEANISLEKGQKWSGASLAPANLKCDSDVRIMYHNVWGYLNADQQTNPNPIATRLKIATAVYEEYMPDVIGFQEMRTGREDIENWLKAKGYAEKVDFSGNPIWYNTNTLECLDYGSKKGGSGYNTMWCIFKVKATGKVFGMTDSHFTANSMVSGQTQANGDAARLLDAQALLDCVAAIKASEHGGENISIFTGGDYNTTVSNTPYQALITGGLTSVRDVATVSAQNSCHHNAYTYDESYGIFLMPAAPSATAAQAIDHIMIGGNKNAVTVDEYAVISDTLTASTSDHAPHFVDFSFK